MGFFTQYPVSRGSVHIKSAEDPYAAPDFNPGFLREYAPHHCIFFKYAHAMINSEADVATLRLGYKKSREIARRMGIYRGEFSPGHPTFPDGGDAFCKDHSTHIDIAAPDIAYSAEDEKALETFIRNRGKIDFILFFSNTNTMTYCRVSPNCLALGNPINLEFYLLIHPWILSSALAL